MPTPMTMMSEPDDPSVVGDGVAVAVAHGRDGDDGVPEGVGGGGDVGAGGVLFDVEDLEAAELEHQDAHEQQREEGAAGAVLEQAAADVLDAVGAQETEHAHEAEDAQDLHLLDGQAGEKVGPAEHAEEVVGLRLGGEQPVGEVDQEDAAQDRVHDPQHGAQAGVLDRVEQHEVEDRQDRQDPDEDLVAGVLEFASVRPSVRHAVLPVLHTSIADRDVVEHLDPTHPDRMRGPNDQREDPLNRVQQRCRSAHTCSPTVRCRHADPCRSVETPATEGRVQRSVAPDSRRSPEAGRFRCRASVPDTRRPAS